MTIDSSLPSTIDDMALVTLAIHNTAEISRHAVLQVARQSKLTVSELRVLTFIDNQTSLQLHFIRRALAMPRSTAHEALGKLAEKNFVEIAPVPTDKRSWSVKITGFGTSHAALAKRNLGKYMKGIFSHLSAAELSTLKGLMVQLTRITQE